MSVMKGGVEREVVVPFLDFTAPFISCITEGTSGFQTAKDTSTPYDCLAFVGRMFRLHPKRIAQSAWLNYRAVDCKSGHRPAHRDS